MRTWALQPRKLVVLGTLVLVGCAGKRQPAVAPALERIAVQVTNHHFLDVVVYAVCEGQRTRIGVAGGSGYTLMDVPRRLLGPGQEMRLVGDAIGSNLVRSSVGVY